VKDEEIDEVLKSAGHASFQLQPATLRLIGESIKPSLRPVRPLPPTWVLTCGLVLVCAAVSILGAARAGFFGFEKMDFLDRSVLFSELVLLIGMAGVAFVDEMIPGSRRSIAPGAILGLGSAALLTAFALIFRDYRSEDFVSVGIKCLLTGLLHAIPAALLSWLVVRRGFATKPISAGLVAGTLGGLAGVGMLELHCPNFEAAHILVWHTAVMPLSGALGALVVWVMRFRTKSRP
jgi:hypothetical protein